MSTGIIVAIVVAVMVAAALVIGVMAVMRRRRLDGATFTLATLMTTFLARTSVPLSSSPAQHPASGAAVSSEKAGTFHVNRDHRGHRCGRHGGRSPGHDD